MSWLWDLLNNFNLGAILYRLIFPEPVGDATLPPKYIYPPDALPPFEGGQCSVPYNVTVRVWIYTPSDQLRNTRTDTTYNIQGPLLGFKTKEVGYLAHHFGVDTPSGFHMLYSATSSGGSQAGMVLSQYEATYFWDLPASIRNDRFVYGIESIVRADGLPDNCGSLPPPPADRERSIPVSRPVPVPVPLPPVVTPPVPIPVPIPPAPPLPPSLPRPPLPINPPIGIDLDVNLNFNFYTDIDFNFEININNGTGTLPIEPFQSLAKLLYAILMEVKESRQVIDRMAKQIDCLAEKFCREGKETYRLPLGIIGYSKRSLYGLPTEDSELKPIAVQILFAQIQNAAGRRVRPSAPNLYSSQALGYYAFQFESGGFGELGELRFSQPYISIPERAIAIAFWIEPQAGDGYLYCWYEKTKYEEE